VGIVELGSSVVLKERWMRPPCFVARRLIGAGSFLGSAGGADGAAEELADDVVPDVDKRALVTISRSTMLTAGAVLGREARQMGQRGFAEIRER
jgi:hypothetical protein